MTPRRPFRSPPGCTEGKRPAGGAAFYKRFRGSKYFLIALLTFITAALALHFVLGIDPEFGALNLALSIEASVGMSLFMAIADRQDVQQAKQLEYMQHLMEAQLALVEALAAADEKSAPSDGP